MSALERLEENRLTVLRQLGVLDSGSERLFDQITQLTAQICDAPVSLVSLVDHDRQWFKSHTGLDISETPIDMSICKYVVQQNDYLEIEDTLLDKRTANNPLCYSEAGFRFYAGQVIRSFDGWPLGALCVLDKRPRKLNELQKNVLTVHAQTVAAQLQLTKEYVSLKSGSAVSQPLREDYVREIERSFEALTTREKEVLRLLVHGSEGTSSKDLARALGISPRTVDHHRSHIMKKMGFDSIAELVSTSIRAGIAA